MLRGATDRSGDGWTRVRESWTLALVATFDGWVPLSRAWLALWLASALPLGCVATPSAESASTASASASAATTLMPTARVQPLPLRLERSLLVPGIRWVDVATDAAARRTRRFVIMVPPGIAASNPRPLVVFLHGAGGGGRLLQTLTCLLGPAFAKLAPIVIAPEAGRGEWWLADATSYVLGLTQAAVRDWPVRKDRTVIMGYSNGGIGTWFFARLYPEPFSAAIPMASNQTIVGESPLPIFAIHGSRDEVFELAPVRASVAALTARGLDVQLRVKPGGTHHAACGYAPELGAAAAWLEQAVWTPARAPRYPHPASNQ